MILDELVWFGKNEWHSLHNIIHKKLFQLNTDLSIKAKAVILPKQCAGENNEWEKE